ncbi:MAG: hypothetical protein IIA59_06430 [Candidatus Marinimicrobia bacterium]|nr:hypothetical protein [Candidatus Neomarinimicrobiota bacterium]
MFRISANSIAQNSIIGISLLLFGACENEMIVSADADNLLKLDRPPSVTSSDGTYVDRIRTIWGVVPGATNYNVFRFDSTAILYVKIGTTSNIFYNDTTIADRSIYYYKVNAYNSKGHVSDKSEFDGGFLAEFISPAISASDGISADKIIIQWARTVGADKYFVYRSNLLEGPYVELNSTSNNFFDDITVIALSDYYYKVLSYNTKLGYSDDFSNIDGGYRLEKYEFSLKWGQNGSETGQLNRPYGIVTSSSGDVYVSDYGNNRIQVFNPSGNYIRQFGVGELNYPRGLVFDLQGDLYVADSGNDRIKKYDSQGNLILQWGSRGSEDGQFNYALRDIAIDIIGDV